MEVYCMIGSVDVRVCSFHITRRKFMAYTVLRFAVAVAIGTLIALLEHRSWLPCHMSQWILISMPKHSFALSIIGPLFTQTLPAPLLAVAGVHRMGYPYASRILYSLFWLLHGIDMWSFLLALSQNGWRSWFALLLMIVIVAAMACVMLRIHLTATAGITYRASTQALGMPPIAYFLRSVRLWGALLILQLTFDVLYLSIL
jgi:hypothetical protein